MRITIILAAFIVTIPGIAHAESFEKQFKRYMALTPQHFVETATLIDDRMETTAVITTQNGFQIKQGLLKRVNDDGFFRAFIDKKTGKTRYQLYHTLTYAGDWVYFEQVNYEGVTEVQSKPLDVVSREVGNCSEILGCFKNETVAFDVEEETLRRVAAGYDPSGKGTSGWLYRLKAKNGVNRDEGMSPAEAAGILSAVDLYKTKVGFTRQ